MRPVSLVLITVCLIAAFDTSFQFEQDQNINDLYRREHSLSKPYGGSGAGIPFWDFVGSTIVTNKMIRLTSDSQSLQGGLWNIVPVEMKDWEVQFQFHAYGSGKDLSGDGFAFWYAKERNHLGPVFGTKDFFSGLAIFFDTYSNHNSQKTFPYIYGMVNNGSLHYDHEKDGANTELAGCEASFRNKDFDTFVAVRYQNYKLTVSTDIENKNVWKECFAADKIKLPTGYYFGFTAATGELSDNHDIISVKVYQLDSERKNEIENPKLIEPRAENFVEPTEIPQEDKPSSAWLIFKWFFIILFIILAVVGVGFAGWYLISNQQKNKKRFY